MAATDGPATAPTQTRRPGEEPALPEDPAVPRQLGLGPHLGRPGSAGPVPGERGPVCSGGWAPPRSTDSRSGSKPRAFSTIFLSSRLDGHPLHAPPCTHPAELPVNAEAPVPTPSDLRVSRAERGN